MQAPCVCADRKTGREPLNAVYAYLNVTHNTCLVVSLFVGLLVMTVLPTNT
jgi:hypothetical protein